MAAENLRGNVGQKLMDNALVQRRPVKGAASFQQDAVNIHPAQAFHQDLQIRVAVLFRKDQDFTARILIGRHGIWVLAAGGQDGPDRGGRDDYI